MLKIRLMGTKNEIEWFEKIMQEHPDIEEYYRPLNSQLKYETELLFMKLIQIILLALANLVREVNIYSPIGQNCINTLRSILL